MYYTCYMWFGHILLPDIWFFLKQSCFQSFKPNRKISLVWSNFKSQANFFPKKKVFLLENFVIKFLFLKLWKFTSYVFFIMYGTFPKNLNKIAWKMKKEINFKWNRLFLLFLFSLPIRYLLCGPAFTGHISKKSLNFWKGKKQLEV